MAPRKTPTPPHLQLVASGGVALENNCHNQAAQRRLLDDLGVDDREMLVLQIVRQMCNAFMQDRLGPWEHAHVAAESLFGFVDGPVLIGHVVALLRAIRAERRGRFEFMSPGCPICSRRVTETETWVVDLMRAAREGDITGIGRAATELADMGPAPRIATVALRLGEFLGPRRSRHEAAGPPPTANGLSFLDELLFPVPGGAG